MIGSRFEHMFAWMLGGVMAAVVGIAWAVPTPPDWSDSFAEADPRPYASEVVRAVLPDLFPKASVESVSAPPFVHLRTATPTGGAYLFVASRFAPAAEEATHLLDYTARGNTVFVAAHEFGRHWADTLSVATRPRRPSSPDMTGSPDTVRLRAVGMERRVPVRSETVATVFDSVDASAPAVLGTAQTAGATVPVLLRRAHGDGQVLLSTTPRAFTNVHAVDERTAPYLWAALSHIPATADPVWWDTYHKPERSSADTPLRFVLSTPALRHAYIVLLVGIVLFLLVKARRRQRAIPVIEPPTNATVDFVTTLGRLAHRRGDADTVARRRVTYLLASIRNRLDVTADPHTTEWTQRVAERAGVDRDTVAALRTALVAVQTPEEVSASQLERLDRRIQAFQEARAR